MTLSCRGSLYQRACASPRPFLTLWTPIPGQDVTDTAKSLAPVT